METSRPKEGENIEEHLIHDVRNHFRLKKLKEETIGTTKDIRNLFRPKKENKEVKDRIIIDIRNLFKNRDIRNIFRFKKIKIECLEILEIFLSIKKKKKIIINQKE